MWLYRLGKLLRSEGESLRGLRFRRSLPQRPRVRTDPAGDDPVGSRKYRWSVWHKGIGASYLRGITAESRSRRSRLAAGGARPVGGHRRELPGEVVDAAHRTPAGNSSSWLHIFLRKRKARSDSPQSANIEHSLHGWLSAPRRPDGALTCAQTRASLGWARHECSRFRAGAGRASAMATEQPRADDVVAWPERSGSGSAPADGATAAQVLASFELLASTRRVELGDRHLRTPCALSARWCEHER